MPALERIVHWRDNRPRAGGVEGPTSSGVTFTHSGPTMATHAFRKAANALGGGLGDRSVIRAPVAKKSAVRPYVAG